MTVGSSLSFPSEGFFDRSDDTHLVPTSALLVTAELFLGSHWRIFTAYHLPTSSEVREVGGVVVQRVLESTIDLGVNWVPIWFDFAKTSRLELQVFAEVGLEMDGEFRAFPRVGGRINLLQNAKSGIGIYFGLDWALRIDRLGLLYGVAYRF